MQLNDRLMEEFVPFLVRYSPDETRIALERCKLQLSRKMMRARVSPNSASRPALIANFGRVHRNCAYIALTSDRYIHLNDGKSSFAPWILGGNFYLKKANLYLYNGDPRVS